MPFLNKSLPPLATFMTLIGIIVLCGLGAWQLQRLTWKTELLRAYDSAMTQDVAGNPLSAKKLEELGGQENVFIRGMVRGVFLHESMIFLEPRTHGGIVGRYVITPFRMEDGSVLLVNRGFLGYAQSDTPGHPKSPLILHGVLRDAAPGGGFMPPNAPKKGEWYSLDLDELSTHLKIDLQPFVFYAENDPGGLPAVKPVRLSNNHLGYAGFWFLMAGVLVVIYTLRFLRPQTLALLFCAGLFCATHGAMAEDTLKNYTFGPASGGKPEQLVILLHGLGSNGQDLISLAPLWADALPETVFVSPDAPFPFDMAPASFGGYQWFSLQDWSPESVLDGVLKAGPILDSFITEQIEKYGIAADKIALVGFSQGTMMSLYAGPRYEEKLAGVLAYSGALVWPEDTDIAALHKIPVRLIHGEADDVVPVQAYHQARERLESAAFPLSGHTTLGLAHGIDHGGIEGGKAFLKEILH